jgi:hypothetical protein
MFFCVSTDRYKDCCARGSDYRAYRRIREALLLVLYPSFEFNFIGIGVR